MADLRPIALPEVRHAQYRSGFLDEQTVDRDAMQGFAEQVLLCVQRQR